MEKEYDFLLSCLKHTETKPDFEKVAVECGLKNGSAA